MNTQTHAQPAPATARNTPGIHPNEHEKSEWSRMAQDAYARDFNDTGHKFSVAASLGRGAAMPLAQFYALQAEYRQWLIRGFVA